MKYKENLNNDFSIEHKITDKAEKYDFHIHDAFEIVLILSDYVKCHVNDKSYFINKNTLLLFNNMDLHRLSLTKPCRHDRYVLYFKPEYIGSLSTEETDLLECFFFRPFPDVHILQLSQEQADTLVLLLDKICAYQNSISKKLYGYDLHLKFSLGELLLFINGAYREYHNIAANNVNSAYNLIYSIINYIHKNLSEEINLEKIAEQFFISKYYLCSLFKKVTGTSPNQYVINCRIMKAKELLLKSTPVETVCGLVGYNNLSNFSRTFKKRTGISPKKFALSSKHNAK